MKKLLLLFISALPGTFFIYSAAAQTAPSLADAQSFAVLAATSINNNGNTVISGDMGISPGLTIIGFNSPGRQTMGQIYSGVTTLAGNAMVSAINVYKTLAAAQAGADLTGKVLGRDAGVSNLKPGVYNFSSSTALNGTLTLNDGGDPNAVFIFKIAGNLTIANFGRVVMSSAGDGPNVFWVCDSSATIGAHAAFAGNIIARQNIVLNTDATTTGRLFALSGAVTMDANSASAIAAIPRFADSDGDGIPDNMDDYPGDATKAFNNYSSPMGGSTVAFEEQWPNKGDYDMNDLVMVCRYKVITNAQNIVVQVIANFTLTAAGGNLADGFGVEFPIPRGNVASVSGGTLEDGQNNAVIILFTDSHQEIQAMNTVPGAVTAPPKTYTVAFDVVDGPNISSFGTEFNPFLFNYAGTSRREVHLPGKAPTTLADPSLFGTRDDNSTAGSSYLSKSGLPFAIEIPTAVFNYPVELVDITRAYLHFADWAQSGGSTYTDWYSNTAPGYRNQGNIYTK